MSWSRAAVRPCAALYCDRLQVNESATNTATGERVEIDDGSTNAATIPAARAADTRDRFRFIGVSNAGTSYRRLSPRNDSHHGGRGGQEEKSCDDQRRTRGTRREKPPFVLRALRFSTLNVVPCRGVSYSDTLLEN